MYRALTAVFTECYASHEDVERLVGQAGIDAATLPRRDTLAAYWQAALRAAHRREKISALVEIAVHEYPERAADFHTALGRYTALREIETRISSVGAAMPADGDGTDGTGMAPTNEIERFDALMREMASLRTTTIVTGERVEGMRRDIAELKARADTPYPAPAGYAALWALTVTNVVFQVAVALWIASL